MDRLRTPVRACRTARRVRRYSRSERRRAAGRAAAHRRRPLCFPSRERCRSPVGISTVWHRVRDAAGLSDLRIHDCRHTVASAAVAGGSPRSRARPRDIFGLRRHVLQWVGYLVISLAAPNLGVLAKYGSSWRGWSGGREGGLSAPHQTADQKLMTGVHVIATPACNAQPLGPVLKKILPVTNPSQQP